MLVFMHDAGIYAQCWYLCTMLVCMHDAGIYARCWYLCMLLVLMSGAGVYEGFLITLFLLLAHLF